MTAPVSVWIWALAVAASFRIAVRIVRQFAQRKALLVVPSERSSHHVPVPRLGGAAFMPLVLLAVREVFIVSDGRTYSTRQMYDMMCHALDRQPSKWSVPLWCLRGLGFLGDAIGRRRGRRFAFDSGALEKLIGSAWFSSAKIEERLGFKPEWDLEKAMPEMVAELNRR